MVTADVVSLYPSIHHDAGLEALKKRLIIEKIKRFQLMPYENG